MLLAKNMEILDRDVFILVTRLMDFVLERTIWVVGFESEARERNRCNEIVFGN